MYGIPNCDTIRKARKWLETEGVAYQFHDYKKSGIAAEKLGQWVGEVGWEALLNKRGTTFRKLPDGDKSDLDADKAMALMEANPSMIKRPVIEHAGPLLVGFDPEGYEKAGLG
ncbi:MAG: ArsC family reductase [Parasphingopyxis sp.]